MRDRSSWHGDLAGEFRGAWKAAAGFGIGDLLDVELAIYLGTRVMPTRPVRDIWTLLSGYPYEEVFGDVRTSEARLMIRRARHFLWDRSRRYTWHNSLHMYLDVDITLRGYTFATIDDLPKVLEPTRAHDRREIYERLLTQPPPLERRELPIAGAGDQLFYVRDQRHSVNIPVELIGLKPWIGHDTGAVPAGNGEPITVTMTELEAAADAMDALEVAANAADLAGNRTPGKSNDWKKRLRRVELLLRDEAAGAFQTHSRLRIDRLMNLVGMVGAGKSTIRDILAFQLATRERPADRRRTTIVVGDVAEVLTITEQFRRLGVHAAPILGKSTLERNIQRLHRRSESATQTMLNHDNPGFAHLSSACPLDAFGGSRRAGRWQSPPRHAPVCTTLTMSRRPRSSTTIPTPPGRGSGAAGSQPGRNVTDARCGLRARGIVQPATWSTRRSGSPRQHRWCTAVCPTISTTRTCATWSWPAAAAT